MNYSADYALGLVAAGCLVALVATVWRFTTCITRMSSFGERFSERIHQERDRFFLQVLEKKSVRSDEAQVRLAGQHGQEAMQHHRDAMARDGAAEDHTNINRKVKRAIDKHMNRPSPHAHLTEKDMQA